MYLHRGPDHLVGKLAQLGTHLLIFLILCALCASVVHFSSVDASDVLVASSSEIFRPKVGRLLHVDGPPRTQLWSQSLRLALLPVLQGIRLGLGATAIDGEQWPANGPAGNGFCPWSRDGQL
jgi:hypothetical protein